MSTEKSALIRPTAFRKRPVVITAMRFDGTEDSQRAIVNWSKGRVSGWFRDRYYLEVETLEGVMACDRGDWVIKGVKGEFYPCKPDIFAASYERVPADEATK